MNDHEHQTEAAGGGSALTEELGDDALAAVDLMIRTAEKNGLLMEVVLAFGQCRAAGDSTHDAAHHALCDWDM